MNFEFRLPDIGEGLTEVEIVAWLVDIGEKLERDQPIVEIETDKSVVEIPTPVPGRLDKRGAESGERLAVGEVLATIFVEEDHGVVVPLQSQGGPDVSPSATPLATDVQPKSAAEPAKVPTTRPAALPLIRKLAKELDVDLSSVSGSGPSGQITREDIEAAAMGSGRSQPTADTCTSGCPANSLSNLRRSIAEHMSHSWQEIPHVTAFAEADIGRLLNVRKSIGEHIGNEPATNTLLAAATVKALIKHPSFNSTLSGEQLTLHDHIDLGMAVDIGDGLLVPVLRNAHTYSLFSLDAEVARLAIGANNRTLTMEELRGQTFTVSNVGAAGGVWGHGTPLIPSGTVAILAFGRADARPAVVEHEVAVRPIIPLSLSFDHRVIDGAPARSFLTEVVRLIEEPALFLMELPQTSNHNKEGPHG